MKISKLFHWLYAILMLLPFVFFVPSVLYYAFNDNATMQTVEVPQTETISVDFNQKFNTDVDGVWSNERATTTLQNGLIHFEVSSGGLYNSNVFFNDDGTHYVSFEENHYYYPRMTVVTGSININNNIFLYPSYLQINDIRTTTSPSSNLHYYNPTVTDDVDVEFYFNIFDLTQMFGSGNEPTKAQFDEWFPNPYYPYTESELMQITYDTGETEQLIENTSIINYAWESIWDLPLFSWTKVTFIAVPFTYITGLFGLAAFNTINYVFGYFLSISIVWLVFDVIMYVPLLCHRWIDKARIE